MDAKTELQEGIGAIEAAARAAASASGASEESAVLLRMGGRKVDRVADLIALGDLARAAEDLRAAADYLEIAAGLGQPALRRAA